MIRIFSFLVIVSIFAFGEAYAGRGKNNREVYIDDVENISPKKRTTKKLNYEKKNIIYVDDIENTPPRNSTLKKTLNNKLRNNGTLISPLKPRDQNISLFSVLEKDNDREKTGKNLNNDMEISSPSKVRNQKVPIFSPLLKYSPTTAERKYFSPIRRKMVASDWTSPIIQEIYRKNDIGNYWTNHSFFEGKLVMQADFLFDPHAVIYVNKEETTNLEQMKKGFCPIGHKGIISREEQKKLNSSEIKRQQNSYRIELHHITQNDTDIVIEMTHASHMSENARLIVEPLPEAGAICIVHSSLSKEEALNLCGDNQTILTNVLHRKQKSRINRNAFSSWRESYWKARAKGIEKGNFVGKENLPPFVSPKEFFKNPVKLEKKLDSKPEVKKKLSFPSPINSPLKEKQF